MDLFDRSSSKVFTGMSHREINVGDHAISASTEREKARLLQPSVINRREVESCQLLKISLLRRKDKQHIESKYQNEVENYNACPSESQSTTDDDAGERPREDAPAATAQRQSASLMSVLSGDNNRQKRASGITGSLKMANFVGADVSLLVGSARTEHFLMLQRARRILLEAADDNVHKEIFGDVPHEWLEVLGGLARLTLFSCLLCVIPIVGLMLQCSVIQCDMNTAHRTNATNSSLRNITASSSPASVPTAAPGGGTLAPTTASPLAKVRLNFLHVVSMNECPFSSWSTAMFGMWIAACLAFLFGILIAMWSVIDKCFGPLADRVRDSRKAVAHALSSVPFRTRFFVVVPPLLGVAATSCMIYTRLNANPENVTWSWGYIVAPAVGSLGMSLLLKGILTWKFLASGNAAATAALTGNAIPSYWAIRLFVLDAVALFVASTASPLVLAEMANCDGYENWTLAFCPVFVYLGLNAFTSLVEWFYRLANKGDAERQGLDLAHSSGPRPLWQDMLRLILRQGGLSATVTMGYLKLDPKYSSQYTGMSWIDVMGGALAYLIVEWIVSWAGFSSALRIAKEQYMRLDQLLTSAIVEESLAEYGAVQQQPNTASVNRYEYQQMNDA